MEPTANRIILTGRERQILNHRDEGLPYKLIADALGISINTIKHHLGRTFRKLEASNSIEAINRLQVLDAAPVRSLRTTFKLAS